MTPTVSGGWWLLLAAGVCEVCWAAAIARTQGFTRLWPSVYCAVFIALSLYLLALAMRSLPVGTAYAVWTGIGALGTATLAVVFFAEPVNALRLGGVLAIVAGIAMLKLA